MSKNEIQMDLDKIRTSLEDQLTNVEDLMSKRTPEDLNSISDEVVDLSRSLKAAIEKIMKLQKKVNLS